jgi:hypothetical protein
LFCISTASHPNGHCVYMDESVGGGGEQIPNVGFRVKVGLRFRVQNPKS